MTTGKVTIIGAGPAGMGCADVLTQNKIKPYILDNNDSPGGLCRTLNYKGYLFDMGGHRFLSDHDEVNELWHDVMGDDMLTIPRLSRIYYRKRYFNYPLSFINTFWNLGVIESARCILSFFKCKYFKTCDDETFEGWIINRFGKRLFEIFFNTYTEKVWAVPCKDISADWARERIYGLSLQAAIKNALFSGYGRTLKTLTEKFLYPRTGPGEFYNRLTDRIKEAGGEFGFGSKVTSIQHNGNAILSINIHNNKTGENSFLPVERIFSSVPLPLLIKMMAPAPPDKVLAAADKLKFRSFIAVNVILDKEDIFKDQWLYIHTPTVRLGRIQNYKNWSPSMVTDSRKTSLGLEYFCSENDSLWKMNDIDLIDYAMNELSEIDIVSRRHLINGFVVRMPNVYPVYSMRYRDDVAVIMNYLKSLRNIQPIGRCGCFQYDNSDKALLSGINNAVEYLKNGI